MLSRLFHAIVVAGVSLGTASCGGNETQGGLAAPAQRLDAATDTSPDDDGMSDHDAALRDAAPHHDGVVDASGPTDVSVVTDAESPQDVGVIDAATTDGGRDATDGEAGWHPTK